MGKPIVGKKYIHENNVGGKTVVEILGYGPRPDTAVFFKGEECIYYTTDYSVFKPMPEPLEIGQEIWIKANIMHIPDDNSWVQWVNNDKKTDLFYRQSWIDKLYIKNSEGQIVPYAQE